MERFGFFSPVKCSRIFLTTIPIIALSLISVCTCYANDWPTYRGDIARSGSTDAVIGSTVSLQWTYKPLHAPAPAWPPPAEEQPRVHIDNAYHTVLAGNNVYYGSCITDRITCLDGNSGQVRWSFDTQGPVRFAPTFYEDKIYAGSDDGFVYCLDSDNGGLIWKYRPGASAEKVIGNGRMISMWPVRTNVLADQGVVYFAAGVFPYEGLYICALDANSGSVIWKNDTVGDRAHELQFGGMSPHGYLVASENILYVPSGRAMPAAFDRGDGQLLYFASPGAKRGGSWALLDQDRLIAGVDYSGTPHKVAYDAETGEREGDAFAWFPGTDLVVTSDASYILTPDGLYAIDRQIYAQATKHAQELQGERKNLGEELGELRKDLEEAAPEGKEAILKRIDEVTKRIRETEEEEKELRLKSVRWQYAGNDLSCLTVAADCVLAGGKNSLTGLDIKTGKEVWKERTDGKIVSIAASQGRIVASSEQGPIYCFGKTGKGTAGVIQETALANPYAESANRGLYEKAAEKILEQCKTVKGYCLVMDCGEGELAYELAKRTEFKIIGLEQNPETLKAARDKLAAAGLLGTRIAVEPWDIENLPDYFANLVVSDGMLLTGKTSINTEQRNRVVRPYGGMCCLGTTEDGQINFQVERRGALAGAGYWTHQYGDPQNTACSNDQLVNGPLGLLWFGEPGPQGMVERHGRAQSPVSLNGLLFIEGEEILMGVDAFNGTLLWQREIPGAVRVKIKADSGNLAVTETGLYVGAQDRCYRLNPETGETIRVYEMPASSRGKDRRWGYIAVVNNILYGSAAFPMKEDYAALDKIFIENNAWNEIETIPDDLKDLYTYFKKEYPDPEDFRRRAERDGLFYRRMSSFGPGGEFTQKEAVTEGLLAGDGIFAIDIQTGETLWEHQGRQIANISIALSEDKIFFADNGMTAQERSEALASRKKLIASGIHKQRTGVLEDLQAKKKQYEDYKKSNQQFNERELKYLIDSLEAELFEEEVPEGKLTYDDADVRTVYALNASTGEIVWKMPMDLTGCGGDRMGAAYADGLLLFFGNHGNHDAWRFRAGGMQWRRITALDAADGKVRWSRPLNYRTRPVIVGDEIILEPQACKLQTGEIVMRSHPITGEQVPWEFLRPGHTCGISAASANGLFYRSACTAFYDLEKDRGVTIFGGYRPGCAISVIPASGLLLSPEASAGCTCSYPIRCSMAMMRKPERPQPWTVYVTPGDLLPVSHLAINLGALADSKDEQGTVWFGYPNPRTDSHTHFPNYGVKFNIKERIQPDMGFFCQDFKEVHLDGTERPWLFTSGCLGLLRCEIPLLRHEDTSEGPGQYTVRLGFRAMPNDHPGQRVFDIKIQNDIKAKAFDIADGAKSADQVLIQEFKNIMVRDNLVLEFIPQSTDTKVETAPLVNFIEIIRENVKLTQTLQ